MLALVHDLQEYMTVVNILNGATWLFQVAGLGAITSLGHLQTCVSFQHRLSAKWVTRTGGVSCTGLGVSLGVVLPVAVFKDVYEEFIWTM